MGTAADEALGQGAPDVACRADDEDVNHFEGVLVVGTGEMSEYVARISQMIYVTVF